MLELSVLFFFFSFTLSSFGIFSLTRSWDLLYSLGPLWLSEEIKEEEGQGDVTSWQPSTLRFYS